ADMRHMHTDLMGAAGLEPAADEARIGRRAENLLPLIVGHRPARAGAVSAAHLLARGAMAADRSIDSAAPALGRAPDDGEISALEAAVAAMGGELLRQAFMGFIGFRHHE